MSPAASAGADAALATRDVALPGLEVVLDGDRFAELLDRRLPGGVRGAEPTYVRYKPGTACVVAYQLTLADREVDAYVLLQRPLADSRAKLFKHADRAGALLLTPLSGALYTYPDDRRVKALPALADPARRRSLLERALPGRPDLWDAALTVLRRKPERRVVARLQSADGAEALVKAHAGDFPAANQAAKLVGGGEAPRTPRRLGRSRTWNVVISEWLPGRPLADDLTSDRGALRETGAALAELHRRPSAGVLPVSAADERGRLVATARLVGWLLPDRRRPVERLARELAERLPQDGPPALCHGDFSADQVVVDRGRIALLDLDEAVLGDPARDLGSFCAALARDVVSGSLDDADAGAAADAVLEGYAGVAGGIDAAAARAWTAAAILRLAPEPFRRRDPSWPERTVALLDRAEALHAA